MNTVKMTIHQALATLKTLDSRIKSATGNKFISTKKQSMQKVDGVNYSEYVDFLKANMQKVKQLISNRHNLRSAIVQSNAETTITIGDSTYTVADAIERKNNIDLEENLLDSFKRQHEMCIYNMNYANDRLPDKLEGYLSSILGTSKESRSPEDVKEHTEQYTKLHTVELVDPNKVKEVIDTLEKEITDFKTDVDFKLSESNATTQIDIEYTNV